MTRRAAWLALAIVAGGASAAGAQSLAARVGEVRDGAVLFHFAGRPGVCGDGERFIRLGRSYIGMFADGSRARPCMPGPVQVRLALRDGAVASVDTWVGPLRPHEGRDLGEVGAASAASYLLQLAAASAGSASGKAIMPAVLADSATVWPALLPIARARPARSARRSGSAGGDAAFWLSRFAAGAIAGRANDPLDNDGGSDDRDDLKAHAVFVMSQLPDGEAVPALLEVARTSPDQRVRSRALFWLGQSGDPRAIDLFESLLRR